MELFLFKTSQYWEYAGGGLAIIAKDFEDCLRIANNHNSHLKEYETPISLLRKELSEEEKKKLGHYSFGYWVLQSSWRLYYDYLPGIMLYQVHEG